MPLPASVLDSDPVAQAIADYLMTRLNEAVTGETLVQTAIAYDGWADHLEEDRPLLQVVRGSASGQVEGFEVVRFAVDYAAKNAQRAIPGCKVSFELTG